MRIGHKRCWFRVLTLLGLAVLWLAAGVRVTWLNWELIQEYQIAQLRKAFLRCNTKDKAEYFFDNAHFNSCAFFICESLTAHSQHPDPRYSSLHEGLLPLLSGAELRMTNHKTDIDLSFLKHSTIHALWIFESNPKNLKSLHNLPLRLLHLHVNYRINLDPEPVLDGSFQTGMPLRSFTLTGCKLKDLAPLRGMPLFNLMLDGTGNGDLSGLRGMSLSSLQINEWTFSDLSPLQNQPLEQLWVWNSHVADLSPLKSLPLRFLLLQSPRIKDLSPLQGLPLTDLYLYGDTIHDLTPLTGMQLTRLDITNTNVGDLSPLQSMPLKNLVLYGTPAAKKPLPAWLTNSKCKVDR